MRLANPFKGFSLDTARDAMKTFKPALRGQGRTMALAVVFSLLVAAFELLRPWPVKVVFDRVLVPQGPTSPGALSSGAVLAMAAAATFVLPLLIGTLSMRATVLAAQVGSKVTARIRRQVFGHLHRLDFPFHQSSRTGDLLVRLMGDVNMVRDLLFVSWVGLLQRGAVVLGTAAVMFIFDPFLALLALSPVPLLVVLLGRSSVRLRQVTRKQRRREGDAAALAAESLRHIEVVKAYAAEDRTTDRFAKDARSGERAGAHAARVAAQMSRLSEALTGSGLALVLFVGARQVMAGRLTPGELLVFVSYVRAMYKPVRKSTGEGARLSKATACAARLLDVLERSPERAAQGRPAPCFHGELVMRNVCFTYPGGAQALKGLSLELRPGQLAVLAGPSGSGKSTLLAVLLRLVTPSSGLVLIDGQPIDAFGLDSYRRRFAYVPQETHLFGASVRDNILYGRPEASDEEVEAAAREALIHDVIEAMPAGYETVLGEDGDSLSGGQARRLMLARAALRDARVLLLDEPLVGLDPESRTLVARAIRRIAVGRTTLVVSHGHAEELRPHVVLHLSDGRLERREDRTRRNRSLTATTATQ